MPTFAVLLCAAALLVTQGPDAAPVRQAYSASKEYRLRVTPGRGGETTGTACRATLQYRARGKRPETKWEVELVNEIAPLAAFVHDSGRWVVTLDEYRMGGAAHTLVVYLEDGEPGREWALDELLDPGELLNVERRGESLDWRHGARQVGFDAHAPHFVIVLENGREIRVDLERLELIESHGPATRELVTPATEMQADPKDPLLTLMEMLSASEMSEQLAALLAGGDPNGPPAMLDMRMADSDPEDPNQADPPERSWAWRVLNWLDSPSPDAALRELPRPVDDLPDPRPGDWVNYIDWMNTHTNAGTAADLFEQAAEATPEFDMDPDFFAEAMAGNPQTLADPDILSWLDRNVDGIALLREAGMHDFTGYDLRTGDPEDTRLIGVLLPTLSKIRNLARAQVILGKQQEVAGDYEAASREYLMTLRSGGQTGRGTTLIEGLVGVAVEHLATDALLDLYAKDVDGQIDYVAQFAQYDDYQVPMRPFSQTIQFERAAMMDEIQRLYEHDEYDGYRLAPGGLREFANVASLAGDSGPDAGMFAVGMALSAQGFEKIRDGADDFYDQMTLAATADYPASHAMFQAIEEELQTTRLTNPVLGVLAPSLTRASMLYTRGEANRRAARAVARIRAYEQAVGELPQSLDELGEAVDLIDPFTNQPMIYRLEGDGFSLYSAGPDMLDDGGLDYDRSNDSGDLRYWPRTLPDHD